MSQQNIKPKWEFWIDRGGTFTDIVAQNPTGELSTCKLLSENPEQYSDAAIEGIRTLLGVQKEQPLDVNQIAAVKMGTTVATNALLERQGEDTLLLITQGFADALQIAYQNRPDIFALDISLPEMLYKQVSEVEERIDTHGNVLIPLNDNKARESLQKAYDEGFRSVAIVLIHGYRYHEHEEKLAQFAREIGFTQISTSHQISPLMKLVSRGDTTVVDAYLTPILHCYIKQVSNALDGLSNQGGQLKFMQSNGGLTDASLFQGKDAILSGPAAVIAGNVETSQYVVNTLFGALNVMAASQGTMNNFFFGNKRYQYYETICGGAGATENKDGASAVHTHMTNSRLTDPEVLEQRYPVILESFSVRKNSGGKGQHNGGDGVERTIRFLEPMTATLLTGHRKIPPYGMAGGSPAKKGINQVQRANGETETLDTTAEIAFMQDDKIIIKTLGGGGYELLNKTINKY